ncbi:MAG: 4'-phosphopantetheinyl transferase superfamily protein [Bacteroidales bacterium]|nr:4'-phosphopantetheinyl transferase superfamily protein [Bacteroidales bacterium]OCW95016.1 siderophore biosynthesis protein [Macellibacteroides sp. HH-ZS]
MPLLVKHSLPLWGIWKIEESSDELLRLLENKQPYYSFVTDTMTEARKCEWLAARVLVKRLLGFEPDIAYTDAGAPFFVGLSKRISISHTKGFAAVILSDKGATGVDIEYMSDRVKKIRSRFMSASEDSQIDPNYETEHLLIYWSAKETLFKMIGQSDVDFKEHLQIHPFRYSNEGVFLATERRTKKNESFKIHFFVTQEFVLTRSE